MTEKELDSLFRQISAEEAEEISASDIDFSADEAFADRIYLSTMEKAEKKGEIQMIKRIKTKKGFAVLLAAAVLLLIFAAGTAAHTYFRYPDRQKLREEMNNFDTLHISRIAELASAGPGDIIVQNKEVKVNGYTVTFEAIVKANSFREILSDEGKTHLENEYSEGTFAVVTISRDDGGQLRPTFENPEGDEKTLHQVSGFPLIHGVVPNALLYITSAFPQYYFEDDVMYYFCNITDELCFADKGLSLAIISDAPFEPKEIALDENGVPYFTESAPALHAMFDLPIDPSYADAEQQETFIRQHDFIRWAE